MIWWLWLVLQFVADDSTIVTLTAGDGPVNVVYEAAGDERLSITARSIADDPIDVTLEILRDEQRLAFNDDHQRENTTLAPLDAAIFDFVPPQPGSYTLRIHSFSGAQTGEIELVIESFPRIPPCETPSNAVQLRQHEVFSCTIGLLTGQSVTITARDTSGTLDPVLRLLSDEGDLLAMNDDHASADLAINVLDAKIADFSAPADGRYTVQVSDFSGMAGEVALSLEISN